MIGANDSMKTFTMVHTSDLHLGSLFSSTPEVADEMRTEQIDTLKQILDLCTENSADALLIAGDMFDCLRMEDAYLERVKSLISHYNVRVFITPGEHDPFTPDSCYNTEWPQNVHIFRGGMEKVEIPEKNTCVWGAGFTASQCEKSLLAGFRPISSRINVLVLYGELIDGLNADSIYNPIQTEELVHCGADYVALGRSHTHEYHEHNDLLYCYSGMPAGLGFDEAGEKGVLCGYAAKGFSKMTFTPLGKREYCSEKIDVSGCIDTAQFVDRIISVLRSRYGEKYSYHLYDIYLIGTPAPGVAPVLSEINEMIQMSSLFYARVTDVTSPTVNFDLLMNDGSLKGAFVRKLFDKKQSDHSNDDKYMRALLYGLSAFEGNVKIDEDY
jgi:DNA repair exonuclease